MGKQISKTHGMFLDPAIDDLPIFVDWDLAAQEDETWNFGGVG